MLVGWMAMLAVSGSSSRIAPDRAAAAVGSSSQLRLRAQGRGRSFPPQISLRGGGAERGGGCRSIDDAAALLDELRASTEATRDEYVALLAACARLSGAGDVQGALPA